MKIHNIKLPVIKENISFNSINDDIKSFKEELIDYANNNEINHHNIKENDYKELINDKFWNIATTINRDNLVSNDIKNELEKYFDYIINYDNYNNICGRINKYCKKILHWKDYKLFNLSLLDAKLNYIRIYEKNIHYTL